jgi:glycosyltransferase involved in cell wall biosynthesis
MTTQQEAIPVISATADKLPVTVLVFTLNEEKNLPDALTSVQWAAAVVVVDSHSSDRTADIAAAAGAKVVQFDYSGHGPKKKNWSLRNLQIDHDWVFLLDADERVTSQLQTEIAEVIERANVDGYCVDREFRFMGRELRCFRPNWNLRLFKHRLGRFEDLGLNDLPGTGDVEVHEHVVLSGRIGFLHHPLLHDDDRGLTDWLTRHNRYATWEAHLYRRFRQEPIGIGPLAFFRLNALQRKRVLRRIWVQTPARPLLRFLIWYILRRGFLDGRQGFYFCVLMAYYELTISAKLYELESSRQSGE